jgi:UDP-glucose 4-epimerase
LGKFLITGGVGFIGKTLKRMLTDKGNIVETISQKSKNVNFSFPYTYKNFLDFFKKNSYDKIFFVSGNPYPQFSENSSDLDLKLTNIPLLNILEVIKDLNSECQLWFSSSVAVYGKTTKKIQSEEDICYPISKYGVSKLMGEEHIKYYSRVYNLNVGSFRIFSTFGPGLKRQVVYDILMKLKNNPKKLKLYGSGNEGRDICFVDNQADRMDFVSNAVTPKGDIFNIGSGKISTISEIAKNIINITKKDTVIEFTNQKRSFDGVQWIADTSKIDNIGYKNEESLYEGLEKTIFKLKDYF